MATLHTLLLCQAAEVFIPLHGNSFAVPAVGQLQG